MGGLASQNEQQSLIMIISEMRQESGKCTRFGGSLSAKCSRKIINTGKTCWSAVNIILFDVDTASPNVDRFLNSQTTDGHTFIRRIACTDIVNIGKIRSYEIWESFRNVLMKGKTSK